MKRYFAHLAYNGTNYHGWQTQPNASTVQEILNKAFTLIMQQPVKLVGAGRTDTGVHARNFFAHFDLDNNGLIDIKKLVYKINSVLPTDILVYDIFPVNKDAHARFDAIERIYKYYICQRKEIFHRDFCWQLFAPLDIKAMNKAASQLYNFSDFTSFSKLHTDVKTNICRVREAKWDIEGNMLVFTISADRFLRNMVRSIVGTLIEIGLNKKTQENFIELIEAKDRCQAGASAPAKGLFLEQIIYPKTVI